MNQSLIPIHAIPKHQGGDAKNIEAAMIAPKQKVCIGGRLIGTQTSQKRLYCGERSLFVLSAHDVPARCSLTASFRDKNGIKRRHLRFMSLHICMIPSDLFLTTEENKAESVRMRSIISVFTRIGIGT
jgi:hypothetical protein